MPLIDLKRLVCRTHRRPPVSSCFERYDRLTRPLRSSPITEPSSLLRVGPPQCSCFGTLASRLFAACASPLASGRLVPAVPRKSLHPIHAPYTPAAVRPVIRLPADLSQRNTPPLVLTTIDTLTTRHRRVHFRSSFGYSPAPGLAWDFSSDAHHHGSLPQQLGLV